MSQNRDMGHPGAYHSSVKHTRWFFVLIFAVVCGSLAAAEKHAISIPGVRTCSADLRQQGRLTILEIKLGSGAIERIALTHPSDYRQGTKAPFEAHLVAETPQHFLIFTDTFDSNPGNPQGQCGASPTGERYAHVVSLENIPHETLSVLIDSCLLDIEATPQSPEWIPKQDSGGFVGRLKLSFESGSSTKTVVYYVAPDGEVSRPETN